MSDTDNKAPKEFDLKNANYFIEMYFNAKTYDELYLLVDNGSVSFVFEEYRKAYDKLQAELHKAQQIAWDRKCDLRTLQSRLEKCEGLLSECYTYSLDGQYGNIESLLESYFAEVESE